MPSQVGLTVAYSLSAAISVSAAFAIFQRREVRGGRPLGMMLLAAALWALCDAIELHLPTVAGRRLISQIQYFGVVSCAPFFFHAAMELARLESRITKPVLAMIWGIPLISLVLAWTSQWHALIWTSIEMPKDGSPFSTYNYGPWFWVLALLPICASCKKVRDDKGYWSQIDVYLQTRAAVEFTHGICPDCDAKLYGHLTEPVPE